AQAADPSTPGHVLAEIAAQRPDLRPAIASNPATYPDLGGWLAAPRDPAADSALAARAAVAPAAPGPYVAGPYPASSTPGPYPSSSYTPGPYPSGPYGAAPAPSGSSRTVLWVVLGVVVAV